MKLSQKLTYHTKDSNMLQASRIETFSTSYFADAIAKGFFLLLLAPGHASDLPSACRGYLAGTSRIGRGEVFTAPNSHFNTSFAIISLTYTHLQSFKPIGTLLHEIVDILPPQLRPKISVQNLFNHKIFCSGSSATYFLKNNLNIL